MRTGLAFSFLLAFAAAACNSNDLVINLDNVIRGNDASDEVAGTMVDAINEGRLQVDDTKAYRMSAPADGGSLPAATPPTFTWARPTAKAGVRHGVSTGDFTWLRFEASGYPGPIDVIVLSNTEWTPTADEWARFTAATGPVKVTVTNAFAMVGIIKEGPYRSTTPTSTFTITP